MRHIKIGSKEYEILKEFPMLHIGWEMDNIGYVVERKGKPFIALSSHGGFYIAKQKELEEKIKEYKDAAKASQDALQMIYKERIK